MLQASQFTAENEQRGEQRKSGALCLSWGGDADIHLQAIDSRDDEHNASPHGPRIQTRLAVHVWQPFWCNSRRNGWHQRRRRSGRGWQQLGRVPQDGDPDPDESGTDLRGFWRAFGGR